MVLQSVFILNNIYTLYLKILCNKNSFGAPLVRRNCFKIYKKTQYIIYCDSIKLKFISFFFF